MVKGNTVKSSLETVGKGILNSLEENSTNSNTGTSNENNTKINNSSNNDQSEGNKNSSTNNGKRVNTNNNKNNAKEKNKSSFMLDATANKQLKLLNLALEKDLGELVIDAIDLLYRKNEKKVEQVIAEYFQTLKK